MAATPSPPSLYPVCGGRRVASILYGLTDFTPELERELDEGRVVLGGCCVFGDDPEWRCGDCGRRWGRREWPEPPVEVSV
jgi:hypothetical protein